MKDMKFIGLLFIYCKFYIYFHNNVDISTQIGYNVVNATPIIFFRNEGFCLRYYVLKCVVDSEDYQEASYGILLRDNSSHKYICNVTDNFSKITELVNKMNEFHVEPCHTENVIDDFKYISSTKEGT